MKSNSANIYREYYSDPVTEWHGRYKWIIRNFLKDISDKDILEIGCGEGGVIQFLKKNNRVVGVEISKSGIAQCVKKQLNVVLADASVDSLPFRDDTFDWVIILETLEHITNPYFVMREIRRVLKARGILLISVPNPKSGHPLIYPGLFEYRSFRKFLEQSGFRVKKVTGWQWVPRETVFPKIFWRNRLAKSKYFGGIIKRFLYYMWILAGQFPYFLHHIWIFECINQKDNDFKDIVEIQAIETAPRKSLGHH